MERDKMIEEMTENGLCCIACEMCDETLKNGKFVKAECLESGYTNNCSISRHVAEAFIDAGYRKVPDGAVVLTQEMAYQYRKDLTKVQYLKDEIRKETERDILKKLNGFRFVRYDEFDEDKEVASWTCDEEDVEKFAKEIGVVVE